MYNNTAYPGGGYQHPPAYGGATPAGMAQQMAPPEEHCFFIRSAMNDLVASVKDGSTSPGATIVMMPQKQGWKDDQLWYEDPMTGSIRIRLNTFCLDVTGQSSVVVKPFTPGSPNQQWKKQGEGVRMGHDPTKVLDVAEANRSIGAKLCAWRYNGGSNQRWTFPHPKVTGQHAPAPLPDYAPPPYGATFPAGAAQPPHAAPWQPPTVCPPGPGYPTGVVPPPGAAYPPAPGYPAGMAPPAGAAYPPAPGYPAGMAPPAGAAYPPAPGYPAGMAPPAGAAYPPAPGYPAGVAPPAGAAGHKAHKHHKGHQHGSGSFYIRSCLNNKVFDVKGASAAANTQVIMWQRKANPSSNQLWYLGQDNVIYSKLNGFALKNVGNLICVAPYDPRSNQRWALQGNKIVNLAHPKRCVDISGANKSDGASLIAYDYKGSPNQHWQTDYI